MNVLTKKHRLIWGSDNLIMNNPFEEYLFGETMTNALNFFETDDIEEMEEKIDELGLMFPPEVEEENKNEEENTENHE